MFNFLAHFAIDEREAKDWPALRHPVAVVGPAPPYHAFAQTEAMTCELSCRCGLLFVWLLFEPLLGITLQYWAGIKDWPDTIGGSLVGQRKPGHWSCKG